MQYLLSYEKISQKKIRLNLRTLCQCCRKKKHQGHYVLKDTLWEGRLGQLTFHTGVSRICQTYEDNAIPVHCQVTITYCKIQEADVQVFSEGALTSLPLIHKSGTISVSTIPLWPVPAWGSFTHRQLILSASGTEGHCSAVLTTDPDPSSEHCKISQLLIALDSSF